MSTDDLLAGLGLVVVLAVGSQLLARRARLPAIVVLLPVGFVAGIATDDVHPDVLLGALYQPFVSVAVGVILSRQACGSRSGRCRHGYIVWSPGSSSRASWSPGSPSR